MKKNERNAGRKPKYKVETELLMVTIPKIMREQILSFINEASKPYLTKQ